VHVLRLELDQLRQRALHGLEAPATVEAHGVERRCGRDDDRRVAGLARKPFERVAEAAADAAAAIPVADVQEGQLGDARTDVGSHDADADETVVSERAERNTFGREVPLALCDLVGDGVFARSVREPRRGAPVAAGQFLQLVPVLDVERVDPFGSVDLSQPLEIFGDESAIREVAALAQASPSAASSAAAPFFSTGWPCETSTSSIGSADSRRRSSGLSSRSAHSRSSFGNQSTGSSMRPSRSISRSPATSARWGSRKKSASTQSLPRTISARTP